MAALQWWLAVALLLFVPSLAQAQSLTTAKSTSAPSGTDATALPAFDLDIEAPDEIKTLLGTHLELQRYRALADLSDGELDRLLVAARLNTQELLATLGYFSPAIDIAFKPATSTTASRRVSLRAEPGEPTLVRELRLEFSGPIKTDPAAQLQRQQIQDSWSLRVGSRFTQAGWDDAKEQALRQLTTLRYPAGQLTQTLADIDPASHSALLVVTVDSGPAYRLGELVVSGMQRYDPQLVTRLARLRPGAEFSQAELVQAQQRLSDSGYFDSAFITLDTSGDPQAAPVRVQLREARLQKLVLGVGASTDSGARLSAEHTHHKLPGIGWRAMSKLSLDRETRSLGTELTAPPESNNWRWVTSALLQNQQSGSFDVGSQRLRLGRTQSGERIDRNYYLQFDRAQTAAEDGSVPSVAESLSANYAFTVRNFDSLPFPSSGWGLGLELGGGTTLGSQREPYSRMLTRLQAYLPLGRRPESGQADLRAGRMALRAEAGAVLAHARISLPSTQLFLTGGDNGVRGYGYHDIGVTLADGQTTAGRYLAVGSVEWQRPITRNGQLTQWESTLFVDAGAVADEPSSLDAKIGVGAGVRWKSPVGPLQMDLAYALATQRFRLHLNVGFSF